MFNSYMVRFKRDGNEMKLRLANLDVETPYALPFDANDQEKLLATLEANPERNAAAEAIMSEAGGRLFDSVLPEGDQLTTSIRSFFKRMGQTATSAEAAIDLRLWFDPEASSEVQLPWELLHNGERHLVLDGGMRISRYITYFGDRQSFSPVKDLNILFVISRPKDLEFLPHYVERNTMVESLIGPISTGQVHIDVLETATLDALKSQLQNKAYHIVHFDGHGGMIEGIGHLCFENNDETTDHISADAFAQVLEGSGVRLAILSACQSGMVKGGGIFNSVAPRLIRSKVPAVIAMQFTIPIGATVTFAEAFYRAIGRGESVSSAVAQGRSAISSVFSAWYYPVLYLRVADGEGYLFSPEPAAHTVQRLHDLYALANEWMAFGTAQQALFPEGAPSFQGQPIDPSDFSLITSYTTQMAAQAGGQMAGVTGAGLSQPPGQARPQAFTKSCLLEAPDAAQGGSLGKPFDIDHGTVALSGPNCVYLFVGSGDDWRFQAKISHPNEGLEYENLYVPRQRYMANQCVALSGDVLAVNDGWMHGDPDALDARAAYLRQQMDRNSEQIATTSDPQAIDRLDQAFKKLQQEHQLVLKLAKGGCVHVFTRSNGTWNHDQTLFLPDPVAFERLDRGFEIGSFGKTLALDGDTLFISSLLQLPDGGLREVVYVFNRRGGAWQLVQRLPEHGREPEFSMDRSMAISGDRAAIGDWPQAQVTTYIREAGVWKEDGLLQAPTGDSERFGALVALEGDRLVVGSTMETAAYVYEPGPKGWELKHSLAPAGLLVGGDCWESHGELALIAGGTGMPIKGLLTLGRDRIAVPGGSIFELREGKWTEVIVTELNVHFDVKISGDDFALRGVAGSFV